MVLARPWLRGSLIRYRGGGGPQARKSVCTWNRPPSSGPFDTFHFLSEEQFSDVRVWGRQPKSRGVANGTQPPPPPVIRPMGTAAYGGKGQGKGKGRGEGRLGHGGRGRSKGGEKPMGTTAWGGKGSKGRAANGDRPVGAAGCRRDHHTMASCQNPPVITKQRPGVGARPWEWAGCFRRGFAGPWTV